MGKRISQRRRAALMAAVSASALLWNASARGCHMGTHPSRGLAVGARHQLAGRGRPNNRCRHHLVNDSRESHHRLTAVSARARFVFLANKGTGDAVLAINVPEPHAGRIAFTSEATGMVSSIKANGTVSIRNDAMSETEFPRRRHVNLSGGSVSQSFDPRNRVDPAPESLISRGEMSCSP